MKRMADNQRANREMKQYCIDHDIRYCELRLPGCQVSQFLSFAHAHKRRWYYEHPVELLWDRKQWRLSCQNCHSKIEFDKELTASIFGLTD